MPNEKSKILNKKRTLIIVLGVLLALLITLKSDQLFSFNETAPVNKENAFLNSEQGLSYLIDQFNGVKTVIFEAKNKLQGLQN